VAGDDCAGQNLRKSTKKPYFVQMVNGGPPRPTKIIVLIKTIQYEATFRLGLRTRILAVWWYRFQNSITVGDIDLKFGMVVVFGNLEDLMHDRSVHKLRHTRKNAKKCEKIKIISCRCFLMILSSFILYFILKIIKKNIF
jgi:hypothetical protein